MYIPRYCTTIFFVHLCLTMVPNILLLFCTYLISAYASDSDDYKFPFVRRDEWHARRPVQVTPLETPVPIVVIHHTSTVHRCYDRKECIKAMRAIQNYHMDDKGWWDIGYNFAVGSDGVVYEGRGWKHVGAQALHFNEVSIGITFIGNWTLTVPPKQQIDTVKALVQAGVNLGFVKPDYILVGHRDVRTTQCPGDTLYGLIKTWPHYLPKIEALGPVRVHKHLTRDIDDVDDGGNDI